MSSWVEDEFCSAQFGDNRLNKRFFKLASDLAQRPSESIHTASQDWAATKAAYRFFNNSNVEHRKILNPHFESTQQRTSKYKRVIVAEDTSFINFSSHQKTTGLGKAFKVENKDIKGICIHSGLALSETGLPLGLVYNKLWTRKKNKLTPHQRENIPFQLKETYRWAECIKKGSQYINSEEVIFICDREGDIHEVFETAMDCGVDLIVRNRHNRYLDDEIHIADKVSIMPVVGQHKVKIPSCQSRKEREAVLNIRFGKIEISARPFGNKTKSNKSRTNFEVYIIDASELGGEISWRLLSTLPIESLSDAKKALKYYSMRWNVELFFKTLKTGCTVEKCCLGHGGKLIKYISLMSVVAWRLFWMTFVSRQDPDITCEVALTKNEWQTAWYLIHKNKIKERKIPRKPPDKPPTLKQAIRWIAGLGGFLGRKNDGEPGIITFWRGWTQLVSGVEIYEIVFS
jgi:hypothetical protein